MKIVANETKDESAPSTLSYCFHQNILLHCHSISEGNKDLNDLKIKIDRFFMDLFPDNLFLGDFFDNIFLGILL